MNDDSNSSARRLQEVNSNHFASSAALNLNRESSPRTKLDVDCPVDSTATGAEFGGLIGESAAIKMVFTAIERIATTDAPVLIVGESGTGKELAARAIHQASSRAGRRFDVVDCSRLLDSPSEANLFEREGDCRGVFERAERGTLFFDELGDLPLALQCKVLHVLREQEISCRDRAHPRHVDVRIIASTHRDLRQDINRGLFRSDLYYRLSVIQMRMPTLRERPEDIAPLVRTLLPQIVQKRGLTAHIEPDDEAIASFSTHSWPGNVRELRNCLEHLVTVGSMPDFGDHVPDTGTSPRIPYRMDSATPPRLDGNVDGFEDLQYLPLRAAKAELIRRFEHQYISQLLVATGGNVAEAARLAHVDRVTLFRTLRRMGQRSPRIRPNDPSSADLTPRI